MDDISCKTKGQSERSRWLLKLQNSSNEIGCRFRWMLTVITIYDTARTLNGFYQLIKLFNINRSSESNESLWTDNDVCLNMLSKIGSLLNWEKSYSHNNLCNTNRYCRDSNCIWGHIIKLTCVVFVMCEVVGEGWLFSSFVLHVVNSRHFFFHKSCVLDKTSEIIG